MEPMVPCSQMPSMTQRILPVPRRRVDTLERRTLRAIMRSRRTMASGSTRSGE